MRNNLVARGVGRVAAVLLAAVVLSGGVAQLSAGATATATTAKHGGSMIVALDNIQWPSLDPALDVDDSTDQPILDAIYGELFEQGPNHTIIDDLASGYSFSNHNLQLNITIRPGIKFSDGTPFTAAAVASSFQRDLLPANACVCISSFNLVTGITTKGKYTVVVQLSAPYAPIVEAFIGTAPNWVVSPTALASEPVATFGQTPVGAGPFEVVSNEASSQTVLKKNPNYFVKGEPYLSNLTFTATATDQSTVAALQSGSAQVAIDVTTDQVIQAAKSQFKVQSVASPGVQGAAFNTQKAPFNNISARLAVMYATDPAQILAAASPGFGALSEAPQGPGGLFYEKKVPGWPTYNLAKAKALVQQLGGLSFTLEFTNTAATVLVAEALQNQWASAGITATLDPLPQATYSAMQSAGNWQIHVSQTGSYEPYVGQGGLENRFGLSVAASGVRDPTLQGMLNQSIAFYNTATRLRVMDKIYEYIGKNAYVDTLFAVPTAIISDKNVANSEAVAAAAPSAPQMFWEQLAYK